VTRTVLAIAGAAILAASGCRRSAPSEGGPGGEGQTRAATATSSVAGPDEPLPVDHLAPDEPVEGRQKAFGVTLPRDLHVEQAFVDVVYARGPLLNVHPLARYFRARLENGSLRETESSATFERVEVRGKPGLELRIRVLADPWGGSRVEIRDESPAPAANLPDEPARWKQAGLTPEGHVADPTHLN
jgi:hypothetical protein